MRFASVLLIPNMMGFSQCICDVQLCWSFSVPVGPRAMRSTNKGAAAQPRNAPRDTGTSLQSCLAFSSLRLGWKGKQDGSQEPQVVAL